MIEGVEIEIDREGVVVVSPRSLRVVSSAAVGGGMGEARAIVNLHVPRDHPCTDPAGDVALFCRERGIPAPWVGLLTSARTDCARAVSQEANGIAAVALVTVGLSNPVAAGWSPAAVRPGPRPEGAGSTINTIVLVDADPEAGALVNAVMTATEAKTMAVLTRGIRCADGCPASGTSTDAVVVAATGRGPRLPFGGPVSDLGWAVASVVRAAVDDGIRRWVEAHS